MCMHPSKVTGGDGDEGRRLGYRKMRLDTIADRMTEAISLYNRLGFREIGPYGAHAEGCTTFMELDLSGRAGTPTLDFGPR